MPRVVELRARPLDIELTESFGIATGAQHRAHNVLVTLTLDDGTSGLGEAAPFPAVNGETQGNVLDAIDGARAVLLGKQPARWRELAEPLSRALPNTPSLRCALECAMLDAHARHQGVSLWTLFGAKQAELESDITIVTGDAAHARRAAERAREQGFTLLKVKVGADSVDGDAIVDCCSTPTPH
jgi:L-alanine-DL-glutamate epimerase-like enolase superfamily enzyme